MTSPLSCAKCHEIWEPKSPGTLWATPGLSRDCFNFLRKVKIKQSRNRPGVAQRVPGGLGSQIPWHSAHEGGEVVSPTHRPTLPPGNFPGTHFYKGLSRPQDHGAVGRNMSLKNPAIAPGIDPGTVQLVAQRLNHYATPGPLPFYVTYLKCSRSFIQDELIAFSLNLRNTAVFHHQSSAIARKL
jgi:hypothetical protein